MRRIPLTRARGVCYHVGMDLSDVRDAYLSGEESLRDVAVRFDVPAGTVRRVAVKERWADKRDRLKKEKRDKKGGRQDDPTRARTVDFSVLAGAEKELEQALVLAVKEIGDQVRSGDLYRGWGRDMADIAQALNTCIRAKRDMGDAPDQAERARQEIAKAKVDVERERNRMQKRRDESASGKSGEIHVTVTGIEDGGAGYGV